jgi:hypothetical protein
MAGPGVVPGAETLEGPGAGIFDGPAVDPEGDALQLEKKKKEKLTWSFQSHSILVHQNHRLCPNQKKKNLILRHD